MVEAWNQKDLIAILLINITIILFLDELILISYKQTLKFIGWRKIILNLNLQGLWIVLALTV